MFVERLSGLNPRPALIKEPLRYQAVGRDGSIKDLVFLGRVRELLWTCALLPASLAQGIGVPHAKPMKLIARLQPKPVQALTLLASHLSWAIEGIGHLHVRSPFRDDRDIEAFAQAAMHRQIDVGHVADHDVWSKIQSG